MSKGEGTSYDNPTSHGPCVSHSGFAGALILAEGAGDKLGSLAEIGYLAAGWSIILLALARLIAADVGGYIVNFHLDLSICGGCLEGMQILVLLVSELRFGFFLDFGFWLLGSLGLSISCSLGLLGRSARKTLLFSIINLTFPDFTANIISCHIFFLDDISSAYSFGLFHGLRGLFEYLSRVC